MPAEDESLEPDAFADGDYVPAFFARNIAEAEEYCELLNDHEIPARAGLDEELLVDADPEHRAASRRGMTHGVPVLVPERLLDEASEVIADREDLGDFEDDEEQSDESDDDDESFGLGEVVGDILEDEEDDDDEDKADQDEDQEHY